jgi:peptide deformylase
MHMLAAHSAGGPVRVPPNVEFCHGRVHLVKVILMVTPMPVRYLGDPILRTPADQVTSFDARLRALVDRMFATMYEREGVGLAANQVGVGLSVFVYDCDGRSGHVVNPRLTLADDDAEVTEHEGCLSVPGHSFPTPRRAHAQVTGVDVTGAPVDVTGEGYLARCLQHEVDHLRGKVYLDHLRGEVKRSALLAVSAAPR